MTPVPSRGAHETGLRGAVLSLWRYARDTLMVGSPDRREEGLDLARAIAIVGMVCINFPLMLARRGGHSGGSAVLAWLVHMPSGRASSLFVTLAGVGMSMLARRAWRTIEPGARFWEKIRVRQILLLRAACLVPAGILLHLIWSIDILHFYGVYLTICALLFVFAPTPVLVVTGLGLLAGGVALEVWAIELPHGAFTTPSGFLVDAFVDGVHPVFPWLCFMLYGLWLGRRDLSDRALRSRGMAIALFVFGACELVSLFSVVAALLFAGEGALDAQDWLGLMGTSWTPDPLYVVSASATATFAILASVSVVELAQGKAWRWALRPALCTGQLALSIYVIHALAGGLIPRALGIRSSLSIEQVLLYTFVFLAIVVLASTVYRRFLARGPLEWLMRLVSSFPSPSTPVPKPSGVDEAKSKPRSPRVTAALAALGVGAALVPLLTRTLDSVPSPRELSLGSRTLSSLSLLQMRDTHTFSLAAPATIVLATHSGLDLYLELYQAGALIAEDDDGGPGVDARIERQLPAGDYEVVVRPYSATTGPFVLDLSAGD